MIIVADNLRITLPAIMRVAGSCRHITDEAIFTWQ